MSILSERISETTKHISNTVDRLSNLDGADTSPTIQHRIFAVQAAEGVWEQELSTHQSQNKLGKLFKNYSRWLDFQLKHSTGGALQGYTLVMDHVRPYV